jgi:hypothetical protein
VDPQEEKVDAMPLKTREYLARMAELYEPKNTIYKDSI